MVAATTDETEAEEAQPGAGSPGLGGGVLLAAAVGGFTTGAPVTVTVPGT
jgi:hypothetical protein